MPIIKPSTAFKQSADWVSAEVRAYMKDQVSTHVDTVQDVRDNDFEKSRFIFVKSLAATFRLDLSSGADDDGVNVLHDNIGRRYLKVIGTGLGGVDFDAQVADLAGRAAYDDEAEGFKVLVSDVGDGRAAIYSKDSGASADWSDPAYVTGPQGSTGDIGGIAFSFDDGTTDADPGAGNIRANNADLSAATTLFVSKANRYANSVAAYLATLDDSTSSHKGYLILTAPDSETQATFSITGLTDASSYVKLTVSGHSGATSFVDAERLVFQFSRTGNAGDLNGVTPGTTGLEVLEAETPEDIWTLLGPADRLHTSILERLKASASAQSFYFYRNAADDLRVGRLFSSKATGDELIEFSLREDQDGFIRLRGIYAQGFSLNTNGSKAANLTGSFSGSDGSDSYYTTTPGDSWDSAFEGTGCFFRTYADNRGGVWQFTVAKDTEHEASVEVSTYDASAGDKYFHVIAGLPYGTYTVEAVFQGDDPSNAPSGGVSRGWLKYDSIDPAAFTIFPIGSLNRVANSPTPITDSGTVLEFAIRATPVGSGFAEEWVPSHGPTGCILNISRKVYVDGSDYDSITRLPASKTRCQHIKIVQTYEAYNANDAGQTTKMWDGVITHSVDSGVVTVSHSIKIATDIVVSNGYMAMLAASHPYLQRIIMDNGEELDLSVPAISETTTFAVAGESAAFLNPAGGSGRFVAIEVLNGNDATGMNRDDDRFFVVENTTANMKLYFRTFKNETLLAGEKHSIAFRYLFGSRLTGVGTL